MWSASIRAPFSMSRNIEAVKAEPAAVRVLRVFSITLGRGS